MSPNVFMSPQVSKIQNYEFIKPNYAHSFIFFLQIYKCIKMYPNISECIHMSPQVFKIRNYEFIKPN